MLVRKQNQDYSLWLDALSKTCSNLFWLSLFVHVSSCKVFHLGLTPLMSQLTVKIKILFHTCFCLFYKPIYLSKVYVVGFWLRRRPTLKKIKPHFNRKTKHTSSRNLFEFSNTQLDYMNSLKTNFIFNHGVWTIQYSPTNRTLQDSSHLLNFLSDADGVPVCLPKCLPFRLAISSLYKTP